MLSLKVDVTSDLRVQQRARNLRADVETWTATANLLLKFSGAEQKQPHRQEDIDRINREKTIPRKGCISKLMLKARKLICHFATCWAFHLSKKKCKSLHVHDKHYISWHDCGVVVLDRAQASCANGQDCSCLKRVWLDQDIGSEFLPRFFLPCGRMTSKAKSKDSI